MHLELKGAPDDKEPRAGYGTANERLSIEDARSVFDIFDAGAEQPIEPQTALELLRVFDDTYDMTDADREAFRSCMRLTAWRESLKRRAA